MEARLEEDLTVISKRNFDKEKFVYENNKISLQIYLKDILYIYRDTVERKLVIITSNNKYLVNLTIKEMLDKLDYRFKQVHRACIVNSERVRMFAWQNGYFELETGENIYMLSKSFRKGAKDEN